jgi:hypothetical protein
MIPNWFPNSASEAQQGRVGPMSSPVLAENRASTGERGTFRVVLGYLTSTEPVTGSRMKKPFGVTPGRPFLSSLVAALTFRVPNFPRPEIAKEQVIWN